MTCVNLSLLLFLLSCDGRPQALEKNQQWLVYDQQREHYLRGVLDRLSVLEQQLNQANQTLSEQHNEAHSDGEGQRHWGTLY